MALAISVSVRETAIFIAMSSVTPSDALMTGAISAAAVCFTASTVARPASVPSRCHPARTVASVAVSAARPSCAANPRSTASRVPILIVRESESFAAIDAEPFAAFATPVRAAEYSPLVAANSSMKPGAPRTMSPTVEPQVPFAARSCSAMYSRALIASSSVSSSPFDHLWKASDTATASAADLPTAPMSDMNGTSEIDHSDMASAKLRRCPLRISSMRTTSLRPASVERSCSRDMTFPNTLAERT